MQGIKDDRLCATLTITLIVGCLMQLNTSMEKTGKRFFQTTPFNLYTDTDPLPFNLVNLDVSSNLERKIPLKFFNQLR